MWLQPVSRYLAIYDSGLTVTSRQGSLLSALPRHQVLNLLGGILRNDESGRGWKKVRTMY